MHRRVLALAVLASFACGGDDGPGAAASTGASLGDASGASGGSAASDGSAGGCDAPLLDCGGACIDPQVDPEHCGGCDAPCDPGLACAGGSCTVACGAAATRCGDACVDTQHDPAHCGGCDSPCAGSCDAGRCVLDCDEGELACGDVCSNTSNDEAHCGGCGNACPTGQPCVFGQCVATTLHHLLITGQSLSTGTLSDVLSAVQPYDNVMFVTGVRAGGANLTSLVPLVETSNGVEGETIASGMANRVSDFAAADGVAVRTLASAHGIGGQPYSVLRKGTAAYANGMAQVAAGVALAGADSHAVRAVAVIHGESDHNLGNADYDQNLLQWQSDYEADVQALTGQTLPVPMFTDQMSSFTALGSASSTIPLQQLAAAQARPDRLFVVAPKYMLPYVADGVHLTGDAERWLGELYAKAWYRVLVEGTPWRPLSPRQVTRQGTTVTIDFWVPVPPLQLDTVTVTDPGNYGFVFTDSSGASPAITGVQIVDDDTVAVELAAVPVGGNRQIHYAMFGTPGAPAGPTTGARGNLRDSDATASLAGYALANWCVHFSAAVP